MKEILNYQKFFGLWTPEFRQGYQDFVWDKGCKSSNPEYLKGYEYGKVEREECIATANYKPCVQKLKKPKGEVTKKVLEALKTDKSHKEIAMEVGCTENYVYKLSKGYFE